MQLIERHGSTFDTDRCIQNIKRQLEKAGGLSMEDFLAADAERTTAPAGVRNPYGYYTQLAKELRHAAVAASLSAAFDPLRSASAAPPEPPRNDKGRCAPCNGLGRMPDGAFCTCTMGRDLEAQARREVTKKPPGAAGGKEATEYPHAEAVQ